MYVVELVGFQEVWMNSKKLLDTDDIPGEIRKASVSSFSGLEGRQVCLPVVFTGLIDTPKHIQHAQ